MHTHAIPDETVPVQYRQLAAIAASTRNFCKGPLDAWLGFDFDAVDWTVETDPTDFDDFINGFWATADTLEYTGAIHRYQWSHGCHTEPNTEPYKNHTRTIPEPYLNHTRTILEPTRTIREPYQNHTRTILEPTQ